MAFSRQPVEILDRIAAAVDSIPDLGNLSAVSKQLHSVVAPRHIPYRIIKAPLLSPEWKELVENISLAENVRALEVQSAEIGYNRRSVDPEIVPSAFPSRQLASDSATSSGHQHDDHHDPESDDAEFAESSDEDDDDDDSDLLSRIAAQNAIKNAQDLAAERIFISALKNMSRLTSFTWSRTPPLVDPQNEDDIWATLAKHCPDLRELSVLDAEKPHNPHVDETDDPTYQHPTRNPSVSIPSSTAS